MAAQQIIIDIDDVNVTQANWDGFVTMNPLNEDAPEDVSTAALKRAYMAAKCAQWLNHQVKRGRQVIDSQAASQAVPEIDLNA